MGHWSQTLYSWTIQITKWLSHQTEVAIYLFQFIQLLGLNVVLGNHVSQFS